MPPQPKAWVDALPLYIPGKAKAGGARPPVKLSANESALGCSPKAKAAYAEAAASLDRYPDGGASALREDIARRFGLDPEHIICGAGSDDVLLMAAHAYAGPGDEVIGMRYGFAIYPICAERVGATYIEVPDDAFRGNVDWFLAAITERTRLIYIANPNNPTGTYMPWSEIERLHKALPDGCLLVLDAAYAEYVDQSDYDSGLALAKSADNVLHTRTFSKIHGLPALRVGWGTAAAPIINALNKVRPPFNLNTPALKAALAALDDDAFIASAKAHNDRWLPWLAEGVSALGLEVVPSVCNFILIRFPEEDGVSAAAANAALLEEGYILRHLPGQGLPNCLRLTVGTEDENRGVLAALTRFMEQAAWRRHNRSGA
jgi:histidinol-phosphate aminotransferase